MSRKLTDEERRGAPLIAFADLPLFGITYSRQHIYKLVRTNKFPTPVQFTGGGRVAFRRADIVAYVESLQPKRRAS